MHPETQGRRAGIYGRESEGSDQSIQGQLAAGRKAAASLGWTVVDEYQDEVSASGRGRKPRVDWPRLLADIESGRVDAVIIRDASRADRDLEYWARFLKLCRRLGVLIYSVIEDYTYDVRGRRDMKTLADEGVRNADESDKISDRARAGHAHAYTLGSPSGGDCPYGYLRRRDPDPNDPRKLIVTQLIDDETAETVRWIFKEIAGGVPLRTVLKSLNRWGVLSPRGVEGWQHSRVRSIVLNPVYIGMRRHNGQPWVKGSWPALVDEEVWYAANRVLEANRAERSGDRPGRLEHWLAGVMKCACDNPSHEHPGGVCGGDVSGRGAVAGRAAKYGCREYGCAFVLAAAADEYIFDALFDKFEDPTYVPSLLRQAESSSADAAAANAELERLLGRKREWEARLASEEDADVEDSILVKIKAINAKIADARKRAAEVSVPPSLRVLFGDWADIGWNAESVTMTLPEPESLPDFVKWGRPDAPSLSPEAVEHYGRMVRDPEFKRGVDLVVRFAGLSIPARRAVVRDLMEVKLYPVGRGRRLPVEDRIKYRFR